MTVVRARLGALAGTTDEYDVVVEAAGTTASLRVGPPAAVVRNRRALVGAVRGQGLPVG